MDWALEELAKYYDKLWADGEEKNWQKITPEQSGEFLRFFIRCVY